MSGAHLGRRRKGLPAERERADTDLQRAAQAVAQGASFFSPAVAQTPREDYMRQLQQLGLKDSYDFLTEGEKEIFQLLAEGKSKAVAALPNVNYYTEAAHRTGPTLCKSLNCTG